MTTTTITRVPAGIPTGGQFAEHDRADSDVELTLAGFEPDVDAAFADIEAERDAALEQQAEAARAADLLGSIRERAIAYYDEAYAGAPIGYTYKAENFRADKIVERLIEDGLLAPAAREMSAHDALEMAASANAIDTEDEWSFDSDDFPKRIWAYQVDPENSDDDLDWLAGE